MNWRMPNLACFRRFHFDPPFIKKAVLFLTPPSSKQRPSNNSIEGRYVVKQMPDIERIVSLYELYKSYKRVAKELRISRNTVRKYVHRVDDVHKGKTEKILPRIGTSNGPGTSLPTRFERKYTNISNQVYRTERNSGSQPSESGRFSSRMGKQSVTQPSKKK
jgi:hypothetical protein